MLDHAVAEKLHVTIFLHKGTLPDELVEGWPVEVFAGADGRDRVRLVIAQDAEHIIPIDRIAKVKLTPRTLES